MNEAKIEGRLVKTPKIFVTKNGYAVCDFLVKVMRGIGEAYDNIPVTAWRDNAQMMEHAMPGQPMQVTGRLEIRKMEKDGHTEWKMSVLAAKITLLEEAPSAFDDMAESGNFPF